MFVLLAAMAVCWCKREQKGAAAVTAVGLFAQVAGFAATRHMLPYTAASQLSGMLSVLAICSKVFDEWTWTICCKKTQTVWHIWVTAYLRARVLGKASLCCTGKTAASMMLCFMTTATTRQLGPVLATKGQVPAAAQHSTFPDRKPCWPALHNRVLLTSHGTIQGD